MNTNKNSYIIIYSSVMVIIVAFLLAFIYQTNIHKIGDDVAYCGLVQLQNAGDVDTTEAALLPDKLGHKGGVCITLEDIVACRHLSHPFPG